MTGLQGRVVWNSTPVASYRVEVREWALPGPGLTYPGTLYGSATTDAAGRFVVMNLPTKGNLETHLAEQNGYVFRGYGQYTTCGDRVIDVGDQPIMRAISALSVAEGSVVSSGPLTITWAAVPTATLYCLSLWNYTDQMPLTTGACDEGYMSSAVRVTTTSYTTPPLASGKGYSIRVTAVAGAVLVGELPTGNVNITAR